MDMGFKWRERADEFLKGLSWDSVWIGMNTLIDGVLKAKTPDATAAAVSQQCVTRQGPGSERLSRMGRENAARV